MPANKYILVNIPNAELDALEELLTLDFSKNSEKFEIYRRLALNLWGSLVREYDAPTSISEYEIRDLLDKYTDDFYCLSPSSMSISGGYTLDDMIEFANMVIAHSKTK